MGVGRIVLPEVDSSNAEAARRALLGAGPCWLLALRQTAARGRRGRRWVMPEGNFAATLLMYPTEPAATVALRSFVAALALFDAFVAATGRTEPFALKWPNDVLLNSGKVAGILLESAGQGGAVGHIAIGIGVNLVASPEAGALEPGALRPVSLLDETGVHLTPEDFLDLLAPAYAHWEAVLMAEGFAPVRSAWLARAARIGDVITARTGTEAHQGRFETIDATGALVLSTARGRIAIPAADVFF